MSIITIRPRTIEEHRSEKLAAVQAKAAALLTAGAPVTHEGETMHIALDDGSRADLTGMATTAMAAIAGTVPWPGSYQQGWITIENVRIPLGAPADGIALAATAGDYYACIIQRARDLKDAIAGAADEDALSAIDTEAGWPA